jgi:hypothetical protein
VSSKRSTLTLTLLALPILAAGAPYPRTTTHLF